jgi:hypothetical protein
MPVTRADFARAGKIELARAGGGHANKVYLTSYYYERRTEQRCSVAEHGVGLPARVVAIQPGAVRQAIDDLERHPYPH